jgi:hypothetical protein
LGCDGRRGARPPIMRMTIILLVLSGCFLGGGDKTTFRPILTHRVWENKPTQEVFDAAVRVLHASDFLIAAADKSSGLISTDWKTLVVKKNERWARMRVRLNLLVLQETGVAASAALSYKQIVQAQRDNDWVELAEGDELAVETWKQTVKVKDDFFLEVQRYCGPSVQRD